jgi:UDP-N-acetylglucosamine/UDP-N-acetylgalactosamine diphosphorylase
VATPSRAASAGLSELRDLFAAHGQKHVFRFWDRLDETERTSLLEQAQRIAPDLPELSRNQRRAVEALSDSGQHALAPCAAIALPEHGGNPDEFALAHERGLEIHRAGRVGVFVVAGGQGSRLGFSGPKGALPVGPISERTLFEIQAQKIRGLARRCGHAVPWYVMTSETTDAPTREFFEESGYFGLDPKDVFIFCQGMVPATDLDLKLILESPSRIFESPNGHGGSLEALVASGAIDDMEARGIDRLFYYQVDNPLVGIADPVFLGFHEALEAEMSCKVTRKTDPHEKVGVVAERDGRLGIVEYTELADAERFQVDATGNLKYWAGNIAIHVLNTAFIRRVAGAAERILPFHASAKSIPTVDGDGTRVEVGEPNGYKFERFVFDALPEAERVCVLEVRKEMEFSPIKNAQGADSLETARTDMVALYRGWLEKTGIELSDGELIEIDHAWIDSGEEAVAAGYQSLADAGDVVRVATGIKA